MNQVQERHYYTKVLLAIGLLMLCSIFELSLISFIHYEKLKYAIILILTGIKIYIIFSLSLTSIFNNIIKGVEYHIYLAYIIISIFIFIFSFGIDFFMIYQIDNQSFSGIENYNSNIAVLFKFFYLSALFFTMLGVMDILPVSTFAELYVLLEALASYISFIFFLSNFSNLRKTLLALKKDKIIDSLITKYRTKPI